MNYDSLKQQTSTGAPAVNSRFFGQVMTWMMGSFIAMGAGIFLIGPFIPPSAVLPVSLLIVGILVVSAFMRYNRAFAGPFALIIPAALGAISYPLLNYYVSSGSGNIVFMAAAGAIIIFGAMAIWGWTTPANVSGWGRPLFFITLGLIAASILNIFIGASWLGFVIAMAVLVVFSMWTVYDIQNLKSASRDGSDIHPATYALNLWLNIWNIFMSLLRILGSFR